MQNKGVDEIWNQIDLILRSEPSEVLWRQLGSLFDSAGLGDNFETDILAQWPFGVLQTEYDEILNWIEHRWRGRPLRILDLATGNGLFTHSARERGHECIATSDGDNLFANGQSPRQIELKGIVEVKAVIRDLLRIKFGIHPFHFFVTTNFMAPEFDPVLKERKFDFIFSGQSTYYWPSDNPRVQTAGFWPPETWRSYIAFLKSNFLKEDGTILITVAGSKEPRSRLSEELKPYLTEAFSVYGPVKDSTNWQALLVT